MTDATTWDSLTPEQIGSVLSDVFGPDFPVSEAQRIFRDPTMEEVARYGPPLREALARIAHR
jgi:hypothetical protein